MISHSTVCVDTTQAGTRILALLADTGLVLRALGVDHALGAAVGWRADHSRQARALTTFTDCLGRVGVGPAGVRIAWINIFHRFNRWWRSSAGHKWIPNVSLIAHTNRHMVGHLAVCITATQTWTWVNTL